MSEALRLAEWCEEHSSGDYRKSADAAAELRRLHAEVTRLGIREAADVEEIGRLHAENERLREALRNFVDGCSLSIDAAAVAREALR